MTDKTKIEWTDATWNPLRGCSKVSEGCRHCYAEKVAARFSGPGQPYEGLATRGPARWTGKVALIEKHLEDPLRWKRPRRIFVNSMSDLFHEAVPDEWIDRIVATMWLGYIRRSEGGERPTTHHVYQVLTKRPERMRAYVSDPSTLYRVGALVTTSVAPFGLAVPREWWPIPSLWLGVSVEDQATADERIPWLLDTPAAVRFVSYEPALGRVDFAGIWGYPGSATTEQLADWPIHWVIVGGESGPGARPFDVAWARSTIEQCREAGVACFVKQLGASVTDGDAEEHLDAVGWPQRTKYDDRQRILLRDRKGGDWSEWPEDLRVREFPGGAA